MIVHIVGARPQFVKLAMVEKALRQSATGLEQLIVHTGQHYDSLLSDVFFKEFDILSGVNNLNIGSGSHASQTGKMLIALEEELNNIKPELVVLYGDTNSTLAGAITAAKLNMPIAHIEAGVRNNDFTVPEEINRILTDRISDLFFCPTQTAVDNLVKEGITDGVHFTGDVMFDCVLSHTEKAKQIDMPPEIPEKFYLATVHRPSNTDEPAILANILDMLSAADLPVIFPVHPRTKNAIERFGLARKMSNNIKSIEPLSYLNFLAYLLKADRLITDSGGAQKEAYFLGIPCVTLRPYSVWPETVKDGWNIVVDPEKNSSAAGLTSMKYAKQARRSFGDGESARRIADIISDYLN